MSVGLKQRLKNFREGPQKILNGAGRNARYRPPKIIKVRFIMIKNNNLNINDTIAFEDVFKKKPLSKRDLDFKNYEESLDPNIDPWERMFLILEYRHRRDEDTLKAMDGNRPDGEARRIAFYESLLDAIDTDQESWTHKSLDVLNALISNSAEELLIALCGWGANSLAKRAGILPDDGFDFFLYYEDMLGKLIVNWDNGEQSFSECSIEWNFEVVEFDHSIFKTYADSAKIESVIIEVTPYYSDECNRFNCISKEERDRTNDEFSYWYCLDDADEDIDSKDDT